MTTFVSSFPIDIFGLLYIICENMLDKPWVVIWCKWYEHDQWILLMKWFSQGLDSVHAYWTCLLDTHFTGWTE